MMSTFLKWLFSIRNYTNCNQKRKVITFLGFDIMRTTAQTKKKNEKLPSLPIENLHNHKVSIIMPVFNSESYLRRTLNSLVCQTFSNIEIICTNDCSTDASLSILNEYAAMDSRVKVFNPGKVYQATARNIGLDAATGDYIMFCDSDDAYSPEMCRRMLEAMIQTDVDLAMCDVDVILEEESIRPPNENLYNRLHLHGRHLLIKDCDVAMKINFNLWNKIFKKSLIDKFNIAFPDGHEHDDALFVMQYVLIARSVYGCPRQLYHYYIRKNSVMDNTFRRANIDHIFDRIHCLKFLAEFIEKNELQSSQTQFYLEQVLFEFLSFCFRYQLDTESELTKGIMLLKENLSVLNSATDNNFQMDVIIKNNFDSLQKFSPILGHNPPN